MIICPKQVFPSKKTLIALATLVVAAITADRVQNKKKQK